MTSTILLYIPKVSPLRLWNQQYRFKGTNVLHEAGGTFGGGCYDGCNIRITTLPLPRGVFTSGGIIISFWIYASEANKTDLLLYW